MFAIRFVVESGLELYLNVESSILKELVEHENVFVICHLAEYRLFD
jgi:hypothetical protein